MVASAFAASHRALGVNGTAVSVVRTIIALLENGQRADGSVALPDCLVQRGAPRELRSGVA